MLTIFVIVLLKKIRICIVLGKSCDSSALNDVVLSTSESFFLDKLKMRTEVV